MKVTAKLLQKVRDPAFADNGCDNPVLRFNEPNLVSDVYKEHVRGWVNASTLTPDEMNLWIAGTDWLRALEDTAGPRLFGAEEVLEQEWWETQCTILVSRRATSRRLRLPMGKEIDVCVEGLLPHAAMWLLELVGEKHLELAMHPKSLLQRTFQCLRKASAREMKSLLARCRALYPKVKIVYTADDVKRAAIHVHLSHWPGLRLCPPFYPDLIALQPAPSFSCSKKHVILHACNPSYATTSTLDATTCSLDSLQIVCASQSPLSLSISEDNEVNIFGVLGRLHCMHPRSFPPIHAESPFAAAAKLFSFTGDSLLRLPERPLDRGNVGFSFTYMAPRVLDETCVPWKTEEDFYQVGMTYEGKDRFFYLSPYVGWGLRLRQTLLTVAPKDHLKGRAVCVVVPEKVDQTTTENLLLASLGFLSDLGLSNVRLVTEVKCQEIGLQSLAMDNQSASFASIHDGFCVFHTMDSVDRNTASPIHSILVDKARRYFLDDSNILELVNKHTVDRFKARTRIIEQVTRQLVDCIETLDKASAGNLEMAICVMELEDSPIHIEVPIPVFDEWVMSSFEGLVALAWWPQLTERLEKCRGIIVSGGVFDMCPHSAMKAWKSKVGPAAKECTKHNKSFVMEGAALHIHSISGHREILKKGCEDRSAIPSVIVMHA